MTMDSDESMASSAGSAEGKPSPEEKKERQRLISANHRVRVKKYDGICAGKFAEILRLTRQIYQAKDQKIEAEFLIEVSPEKEPKFERRVKILDTIIDLLKLLLDKVM